LLLAITGCAEGINRGGEINSSVGHRALSTGAGVREAQSGRAALYQVDQKICDATVLSKITKNIPQLNQRRAGL